MKKKMQTFQCGTKDIKQLLCRTLCAVAFIFTVILICGYVDKINHVKEFYESGGEIVVILKQKTDENTLHSLTGNLDTKVKVLRHIDDYVLLSAKDEKSYRKVKDSLAENPLVKSVQGNSKISISGLYNDVFARAQWSINNPGRYASYSDNGWDVVMSKKDIDMDTDKAWDYIKNQKTSRREVTVAIVDTGVDYKHPDLAGHMWTNKNEIPDDGIDNDNNGYADDVYGWDFYNGDSTVCHYKYNDATGENTADPNDNDDHGTHIAGIIGAVLNNGIGIEGIASGINIKLMPLKINGGEDGTGSISSAIEAIKYATMMGADVCNLSWGTGEYSTALKDIMEESDMLFVAAAGNTGSDNEYNPVFPASFGLDNTISATFIDPDGYLTRLSNYGKTTVDVAAPGVDIFSTVVGGYDTMSGSSMAAPHVSAVAALLYSYGDNLYPSNVKKIILDNIKPISNLEGYMVYPGIPSAYKAVTSESSLLKDTDSPEISLKTEYDKEEFRIPITVKDKGGSGIRAIRWLYGDKPISDFKRGTSGTLAGNDQITVSEAGKYTCYISDYAGNDTIKTYEVKDDSTPPTIVSAYSVSNTYKTRTVTVRVSDNQSSIKRVKYMEGVKGASEFLPAGAGTEISIKNGRGTFKVRFDGVYSIFAIDNRGNHIVKLVNIKTIKATAVKITKSRITMNIGERYLLKTSATPYDTTDKVIYTSGNNSVATVTDTGKIKALKKGKAYISVRTSSGILKTCLVTVIK